MNIPFTPVNHELLFKFVSFLTFPDSLKIPTVAFKARLDSHLKPSSVNYIVFPVSMMNIGDAFDVRTGKFTAPVKGMYLFNVVFCISGGRSLYIDIMVDDKKTQPLVLRSQSNAACHSAVTIQVLMAGQKVGIKVTGSIHSSSEIVVYHDNERWNTFSGCLMHNN